MISAKPHHLLMTFIRRWPIAQASFIDERQGNGKWRGNGWTARQSVADRGGGLVRGPLCGLCVLDAALFGRAARGAGGWAAAESLRPPLDMARGGSSPEERGQRRAPPCSAPLTPTSPSAWSPPPPARPP